MPSNHAKYFREQEETVPAAHLDGADERPRALVGDDGAHKSLMDKQFRRLPPVGLEPTTY